MKRILIAPLVLMLLVSMVLGLLACSAPDSLLEDTKWFLSSYGEPGDLQPIIEGTEITATFDSAKGELSGSAGCNTYFASYEANNGALSISEMAHTEMACLSPEGVMEQEQEYLTFLSGAQSFTADETTLTITCPDGQQLYFTTESR
ncbi:META domain-containing protein [Chloroflexota bacterium]